MTFLIGEIIRKWTEADRQGNVWYYVDHVRDGRQVTSYSNYADPADSQANPFFSASSLDVSLISPLVNTSSEPIID